MALSWPSAVHLAVVDVVLFTFPVEKVRASLISIPSPGQARRCRPVVIDNGTGYTKMGFAGNVEPCFNTPTVVAVNDSFSGSAQPPLVSETRVLGLPGGGGCIGWRAYGDGAQRAPAQCVRQGDAATGPWALGGHGGPHGGVDRAHPAQCVLRGAKAGRVPLRAEVFTFGSVPLKTYLMMTLMSLLLVIVKN